MQTPNIDIEGVVPSIIPEIPSNKLIITYPNNKSVDLDQGLSPHDVKEEPKVSWNADPRKYYTLLMVDSDAPSRKTPFVAEIIHWLVANIKGGDFSTGDVIVGYRGPEPPNGTGNHRCIFMLFEHQESVKFSEVRIPKTEGFGRLRLRFKTEKFRNKYNIEKVFAWNYFKTEWTPEPSSWSCVCL